MKTIQTIALASVSLITSVSSASTSIISCIDFEDLPSGSIYAPVSNFVTNNIDVLITPHPMGTAFQGELVTTVPAPMGSGNRLWTNNVAAEFSAPSSGFGLATKASFKYAYMGGANYLEVNGFPITPSMWNNFGPLSGSSFMTGLGPITINVMEGGVPGGFVGHLEVIGDIDRLVVAGQELWLDDVCFEYPLAAAMVAGDADGDGKVNFADILSVLNNWGP
ncbi:MAG TPA: hypothetical protein DEQ73_08815 [Phycisphaerales bacterium]|jgi:hypothetical protein|nr:MAG: hypothetical protein CBB84_003305 [Phycisphaera sp. TMED24]HCD30687.1 hypothetical protein [Phycisphaerales bacterium]